MTDIDNTTFFRIVDKQVRDGMQKVETEMLPVARKALKDTKLNLEEYPVEGYYGKTPQLTEYFNTIKTLQNLPSKVVTEAVEKLHRFYTHEVFGLGQAVKTAINAQGVWFPEAPQVVISPVVDPLTVAVHAVGKNPGTVKEDMNIPAVMEKAIASRLGKGLVGLGVLVDKLDKERAKKWNPVATTLARETTVLSAYVPTLRSVSMPRYAVSPEVEEQGNCVIDSYNALFNSVGSPVKLENVAEKNAFALNHDLPEMQRCVRIFNLELLGEKPEFYHWTVSGHQVFDFWRTEVVTTDMFKKDPKKYR